MSELKIGDRIYIKRYGLIVSVETITKLTPTSAKSERHTFKVSDNDSIYITGQGKWNTLSASLETPELREEWRIRILNNWMTNNWHRIPIDEIENLMNKYGRKETK